MRIDEIKISISQDPDCLSGSEDYQAMEIEFPSNGVANFVVIKTDRWAFSDVEEIEKFSELLIKRFQEQCGEDIAL